VRFIFIGRGSEGNSKLEIRNLDNEKMNRRTTNTFNRGPGSRGFTLLEVILAMTIFALLIGSVYSVVVGSLKASVAVREVQNEMKQIQLFSDICERAFSSLPSKSRIRTRVRDEYSPEIKDLQLLYAYDVFTFADSVSSAPHSVLGMRVQMNGLYSLVLERRDFGARNEDGVLLISAPGDERELNREFEDDRVLVLFQDLAMVRWEFFDVGSGEWVEEWEESSLPDLVAMEIYKTENGKPIRLQFGLGGYFGDSFARRRYVDL